MFIMSRERFDEYSSWLFDILFEVERRVSISQYANQARIFGYMSEYLLNVYIHHNNLKAKKVPTIVVKNTARKDKRKLKYLRNFIIGVRYSIADRLLRPVKIKIDG